MNFRSNVHELFKSLNTNGFGTYLPNNSLMIYIATNLILYGRVLLILIIITLSHKA